MTEPAGGGAAPAARRDGSDPLTLLDGVPLSDDEDAYVRIHHAWTDNAATALGL